MLSAVLRLILIVAAFAVFVAPANSVGLSEVSSPSANNVLPRKYPRCKALNRVYPHGVGGRFARDKTKSGDPVTNFKRSNLLYRLNSHLDRDNDKIACEKH
jgi:Excalibur calcium-binding domain